MKAIQFEQNKLKPELMLPYQTVVKQLFKHFDALEQIFQDQLNILGNLNAGNMFHIDPTQHRVHLVNNLFCLQFHAPNMSCTTILSRDFSYVEQNADGLEQFFQQELYFLTGDLKPQQSLFLRQKAQQLRQLLLDQVYVWVKGRERIQNFLNTLSVADAEIIDQLMRQATIYSTAVVKDYVQHQRPIPEAILQMLQQSCTIQNISGDEFLPLQPLIKSLDHFCFSAQQFLPAAMYRTVAVIFEQRFNLAQLLEQQENIQQLYRHAQENPRLLSFVYLMHRELWQYDDLLAKHHFLYSTDIWQPKVVKLPLLDSARAVNWLFKQSSEVVDWLSGNIQHSAVRVAVMALSFVDSSQMHPQIILATLQYFQYAAAHMLIDRCSAVAQQEAWFEPQNNDAVSSVGQNQTFANLRTVIQPSILYLDEWLDFIRNQLKLNDQQMKHLYLPLSRVMQAYMLHLHHITQALPHDLLGYIRPETQENRDFYPLLQRYQIPLDQFRQIFYLRHQQNKQSIFDSYVRDYLQAYLKQNSSVAKNITWLGLFQQAIHWHAFLHKQDIMAQLKKNYLISTWPALINLKLIQFLDWCFEELTDLDQIIDESTRYQHCLAVSYTERILARQYVAFHMSDPSGQQLTLGCELHEGMLSYDQLEYAQNRKAPEATVKVAFQFIDWLNSQFAPFK